METAEITLQAFAPGTRRSSIQELEHLALHELPKLTRLAYRQLGNSHDAEDAIQDAFLSACKSLSQFRGTARLSTWFTAILINAARMQRRRRRPVVSLEEQIGSREENVTLLETCVDEQPSPEATCAKAEMHDLLRKAIAGLSPVCRRAIGMYYVDGMTLLEASEILGVPEGTIKAQVSRARARLAKTLRRELRVVRR